MKGNYRKRRRDLVASTLLFDPAYQRALVKAWAKSIAADFDPDRFGVIHVSERENGRRYVIDGQHRIQALKELGPSYYESAVPCLVYDRMTRDQEASLFLALNDSKAVTSISKFKAGLSAKHDREVEIASVLQKYGSWKVSADPAPMNLNCAAALQWLHDRGGREAVEHTFKFIEKTWPGEKPTNEIVRGLGALWIHYNGELDYARLASKASRRLTMGALVAKAKQRREAVGGSVPANVADKLIDVYNNQLRSKRLEHIVR